MADNDFGVVSIGEGGCDTDSQAGSGPCDSPSGGGADDGGGVESDGGSDWGDSNQ